MSHLSRLRNALSLMFLVFTFAACLQTRDTQKEQEEKQVLKKQLTSLQMNTADASGRFQDLEDDNRKLNGRVEALDAKINLMAAKSDKINAAQDAKVKEHNDLYKEELVKINGELTQLKAQIAAIQDENRKAAEARAASEAQAAARASEAAKNPFAAAEDRFEKKQWKEAILDYEKYRTQNPKGKSLSLATYKIGVCFQELGMTEDAKLFFEEVIAKYPKSKETAKAETRLASLSGKKKKKDEK